MDNPKCKYHGLCYWHEHWLLDLLIVTFGWIDDNLASHLEKKLGLSYHESLVPCIISLAINTVEELLSSSIWIWQVNAVSPLTTFHLTLSLLSLEILIDNNDNKHRLCWVADIDPCWLNIQIKNDINSNRITNELPLDTYFNA